eukprot:TRINITY_DN5557_c0_g1_i2.p1 TRINITY_DN5557_c0_g1~~TRINITY_DN5557_c0_g1_i2.p1  ORF type:complete len:202 (+),score=6.28 TRINITY_DN5557_c0_g1_i2:63-608(+)
MGQNRGVPADLEFAAYGHWAYLGQQYSQSDLAAMRQNLIKKQFETVESIAKTDKGLLGWIPFVGNKVGEKYLGDDVIKNIEKKISEDPFAAYLAGQDKGLFDRNTSWVDFAGGKSAVNPLFDNAVTDFFSETGSVVGNLQETGFNLAKDASNLTKNLTEPGTFGITLAVAGAVAALILLKR